MFNIRTSLANRVIKNNSQVYDQIKEPSHKLFSLNNNGNLLDGTFHPIDSSFVDSIGWWGTNLSDASGNMVQEFITIEDVRTVHKLAVIGDSLLDEFPVSFNITLYNGITNVYSIDVTDNNTVQWYYDLPHAIDVTSITYTFTKVNKPGKVIRILDVYSPFDVTRSDSVNLSIHDYSNIYDVIHLKVVDASSILCEIENNDDVLLSITEATAITVYIDSTDSLNVSSNEEVSTTVYTDDRPDDIAINAIDTDILVNIHTVMDQPLRRIFGKVEITYASPFLGEDVTVSASDIGRETTIESVADNVATSEFKWASCHDNKLDGSYHPMPNPHYNLYHAGLWGTHLSDANGVLSVAPTITIQFNARPTYYFKVSGDEKLGNFPVDFTINVYNEENAIMYTENIVGNTEAFWYKELNPTLPNTTKITLTITKISKPFQVFKITEFFNSVVETYYDAEIVNMHLLEELDYIESSITLGAVSSNEMDIMLDNSNGTFNIMDPHNTLRNLVKRNRKVRAWLGAEIATDIVDWYPLGTFYTTKWNIPDRSLTASLTARDRLDLLNYTNFNTSVVYENYTISQLFEIILIDAGLKPDEYRVDTTLATVVPYAWFNAMSHRDALQRLASCCIIQLYCDRDGVVVITNMAPTNTVIYTFRDHTNVISKTYPFAWNEITNYVEVSVSSFLPDASSVVLQTSERIQIAASTSVTLQYNYSSTPVKSISTPVVNADTGISLTSYESYCWGIKLTFTNSSATAAYVNNVSVTGIKLTNKTTSTVIAKDDVLIQENGVLKSTITHDFIQSTSYANDLANALLSDYKDSRYDVSLTCRGNIGVNLKQKVKIEDARLQTSEEYVIKRQTMNWAGALDAVVECKKIL